MAQPSNIDEAYRPMRQLSRTLDILDQLAERGQVSLVELARTIGAPRASVHRLLVALEKRQYIQHLETDAAYQLGPAVRRLAARNIESQLTRIAAPALADLRARTGETINLGILDGGRIYYADTLDGLLQPKLSATVGTEVPPHATALGKAILSKLDGAARDRLLPEPPYRAYTSRTITSSQALAAELEQTALRGFAVEVEESVLSATCIAVPILDENLRAIAAFSISGVSARLPPDSYERLAEEIRVWAHRTQLKLVSIDAK